MTIKAVALSGENQARINHTLSDDPSWSSSSLVEVVPPNKVKMVIPLVGPHTLSDVEIQSVVQLILGKKVTIGGPPADTPGSIENGRLHCWRTYELLG